MKILILNTERLFKSGFLFKLYFLLIFIPLSFFAQPQDIRFEHLTLSQGLPDNNINTIFQDKFGFLWLGTDNGLAKYDGYSFTIYKPNDEEPNSISDRLITAIYEDHIGNLWIGTQRGGLNKFDRNKNNFIRYTNNPNNNNSLSNNWVTVIFEKHNRPGVLWIGTNGGGLNRFDYVDNKFKCYKSEPGKLRKIHSNYINAICEDRNIKDILWIGTGDIRNRSDDGGLYAFVDSIETFKKIIRDTENINTLKSNYVTCLYSDIQGYLWIGTIEGLQKFEIKTYTFTDYLFNNNVNNISNNFITSIYEDRSNLIWIGTREGLNRFDKSTGSFFRYTIEEDNNNSLSSNLILSIFEDRTGMLWCGTDKGLNKLNRAIRNFPVYRNNPLNKNSLSINTVYSFTQDKDGILWIGTRKGLNRFDRKKGNYRLYLSNENNPNSLTHDVVYSLFTDEKNKNLIWIGTANGLTKFDLSTNRFTKYFPNENDSKSLSHKTVVPIVQDKSGNLWLGTIGGGLNKMNTVDGSFTHFKNNPNNVNSVSGNDISALYIDRNDNLWIGTWGKGLNKLNLRNNSIQRYNISNDSISIDYFVVSILEDKKGRFWLGTYNSGLVLFKPDSGIFKQYFTETEGLPHFGVLGLLEDFEGNLWLSTQRGLCKFNPDTKEFTNYDEADGLQSNEFIRQSAYKSKKGELFFGGENGFNAFFPNMVNNPYPPEVVITDFKLFNISISPDKNSPLQKNISETDTIMLSYAQNDIAFDFVGLHYTRPERNRYAYILENHETQWREVGDQRRAIYPNLDPGEYIFRIKAANSDGVWNEIGKTIYIKINPPFWLTIWAYIFYFLTAVFLFFRFRRFIINRELEKSRLREAELKQQAAEAQARAIQLENERKTLELEEARKLQLSMLPQKIPTLPNLEIAVYMKTATEVGGDYYDFSIAKDGTLTIAIGDATGHGLKAGTMVSVMKGLFCSDADDLDIQKFFTKSTTTIKKMQLWNLYMALSLMKIKDSECEISSAGMPPIYFYNSENNKINEISLKGMPLGAFNDFEYKIEKIKLSSGDKILLLTDGFPELFNKENKIFGYENISKVFSEFANAEPDEIIQRFMEKANLWSDGNPPNDDITFIVIKIK
ncbi:MAG: SpoIIE family protein phosphatase [Ignavibacteriales bacterium]|nr:SpoIIE family protein phosphatase [Ignavibacteriales bacterium]